MELMNNYEKNMANAEPRRQNLALMEDMKFYFGMKADRYLELDKVSEEVTKRQATTYAGMLVGGIVTGLLGILLFAISSGTFLGKLVGCSILPAALIAGYILLRKRNRKLLDAALVKQAQLATELEDYYNAYGYCPVAVAYTHPVILNQIHDVIRQGRASTMEAAINILLDDLHKSEMEAMARETLDEARKTAENTRKAAKSARRAAGYAAADFWLK